MVKKFDLPSASDWILNRRRRNRSVWSEETESTNTKPDMNESKDALGNDRKANYRKWTSGRGSRRSGQRNEDEDWSLNDKWSGSNRWGTDPYGREHDPAVRSAIWRWIWQSGAAIMIFLVVWGLFQVEQPWAKIMQNEVTRLATEDLEYEPLRQAVLRLGLWTDTLAKPVIAPVNNSPRYGLPVEEPVKGVVVQAFGQRGSEFSPGILIAAPAGFPVVAGTNGKVVSSWDEGGGKAVQIVSVDGSIRIISPLERLEVKMGQTVEAKTVLGRLARGEAGRQSQLYVEVRRGGRSVDPMVREEKGGASNESRPPGGGGRPN